MSIEKRILDGVSVAFPDCDAQNVFLVFRPVTSDLPAYIKRLSSAQAELRVLEEGRYSWINASLLGVEAERVFVEIEHPSIASGAKETSINVAGPSLYSTNVKDYLLTEFSLAI